MYLVTGGFHQGTLDSTELMTEGDSWVYSGMLPSARTGLKAATLVLENRLIVTGRFGGVVKFVQTFAL